jgi:hypothetical protein
VLLREDGIEFAIEEQIYHGRTTGMTRLKTMNNKMWHMFSQQEKNLLFMYAHLVFSQEHCRWTDHAMGISTPEVADSKRVKDYVLRITGIDSGSNIVGSFRIGDDAHIIGATPQALEELRKKEIKGVPTEEMTKRLYVLRS